jgi:NRPS condensation-like uncharacterized protein
LSAGARVKFAVADELTCYYDRPEEPANVHVEARVPGSLDEAAVRSAVGRMLAAEPGLRARQAATGPWRSGYYWDFPSGVDLDPVQVSRYAGEAELADLRSEFLSRSPSLQASPPFRFLLATGRGGDALMLNAHHARFDGLAALRLLRGVAGEYGADCGQPPLAARQRQEASDAREQGSSRPRSGYGRITRIAGDADRPMPGYGTVQAEWGGLGPVAAGLRSAGCSVNDLLVAALIVTIKEWNAGQGARCGLVQITMPVGDPAQLTEAGQWANRSRLTKVTAWPARASTAAELLPEVAAQTRYAKHHDSGQVDSLSRTLTFAPVPVFVKRLSLRAVLRVAGPICCDTSLISNLGVVAPLRFGAAGEASVWFSTSAHLPRGLSVGAVTTQGRLRLTFRYRRALLTPSAAAAFAGTYRRVLDSVTPGALPDRGGVPR